MHQVNEALNSFSQDKDGALKLMIAFIAFLSFPFSICSLVVSGTANAGFNVFLTAILNYTHAAGAYYVITRSKAPIPIGFLLGSSVGMIVINFETAVYWGQLSRCTTYVQSFVQYSCTQRAAYGAVSAFAVLLFLAITVFTACLYQWREELTAESTIPSTSFTSLNGGNISGNYYNASSNSSGNSNWLDGASSRKTPPVAGLRQLG